MLYEHLKHTHTHTHTHTQPIFSHFLGSQGSEPEYLTLQCQCPLRRSTKSQTNTVHPTPEVWAALKLYCGP